MSETQDTGWASAFREALAPDPAMLVSEWAARYRRLPQSNAEHGDWRNERTPYLVEVMDELSASSPTEVVVLMKGAQLGGTEAILNAIGYWIDQVPGPILSAMPRLEDARKYSRQKIEPMIQACPRLRAKVREPRSRDSGNTTYSKEFPGGPLYLTGANSAAGMRFAAVRYAALDEVDAYPLDVEGEGDPVELLRARQRTFTRGRKLALVSTPTVAGRSRIESAFLETDQRYYHVPCPACGVFQRLRWDHLRYQDDDPSTVLYACDACGTGIEEHHKTKMLAAGRWVPTVTDGRPGWVGFHLSSLYSPYGWLSWSAVVDQWLRARATRDQNRLKTFVNTVLGETWKEVGEAPAWQPLYARREAYSTGVVPEGGLVLTAGVDVQTDRLEVEVVAWGRGLESWSVEFVQLPGKTTEAQVWADLDRLLAREWPHALGGRLGLRRTAVDSGFATSTVYAWAIHHDPHRVMVVKGRDGLQVPVGTASPVEVNTAGKRRRRGVKLWPIGVSMLKGQLYGWLRLEPPASGPCPPGFLHFPEYGEEYFRQLTAESLVARTRRGHKFTTVTEWVKDRERNEALDCRIYARAAAYAAGLDRYEEAHWVEAERQLGVAAPRPAPQDGPRPPANRGGYFSRWRRTP